MTADHRPDSQRDVQRLLGRCMLRIQQYERLLKAMLAHHEVDGPVETLEGQTDRISMAASFRMSMAPDR